MGSLDAVSRCLRLCVPRVSSATNARLAVWYMHDVNGTTDLVRNGSGQQLVHTTIDTRIETLIWGWLAGYESQVHSRGGINVCPAASQKAVGLRREGSGE
jgi:hypothetical protein